MGSIQNNQVRSNATRIASTPIMRVDSGASTAPDIELSFLQPISAQLGSASGKPKETEEGIERLFRECHRLRNHLAPDDWRQTVTRIRRSDVLRLVHEDPFTRRAFEKPRGYAGDAVMMDFIYGQEEDWPLPEMSAIGQNVYRYTTNAAASSGVRARREFIAKMLDTIAQNIDRPDVLAVASGHLREASMSSALRRRRFGNFVALDADLESLSEVRSAYARYGVRTEQCDVRKLLTGRIELGKFDLVYSTGLYDYLNEKVAQRLTNYLFSMLRPGGVLVLANFVPWIEDIGYMEACMDWYLVYRDRIDMVALTSQIDQQSIDDIRVSVEENRNITFIEITRARH